MYSNPTPFKTIFWQDMDVLDADSKLNVMANNDEALYQLASCSPRGIIFTLDDVAVSINSTVEGFATSLGTGEFYVQEADRIYQMHLIGNVEPETGTGANRANFSIKIDTTTKIGQLTVRDTFPASSQYDFYYSNIFTVATIGYHTIDLWTWQATNPPDLRVGSYRFIIEDIGKIV